MPFSVAEEVSVIVWGKVGRMTRKHPLSKKKILATRPQRTDIRVCVMRYLALLVGSKVGLVGCALYWSILPLRKNVTQTSTSSGRSILRSCKRDTGLRIDKPSAPVLTQRPRQTKKLAQRRCRYTHQPPSPQLTERTGFWMSSTSKKTPTENCPMIEWMRIPPQKVTRNKPLRLKLSKLLLFS